MLISDGYILTLYSGGRRSTCRQLNQHVGRILQPHHQHQTTSQEAGSHAPHMCSLKRRKLEDFYKSPQGLVTSNQICLTFSHLTSMLLQSFCKEEPTSITQKEEELSEHSTCKIYSPAARNVHGRFMEEERAVRCCTQKMR